MIKRRNGDKTTGNEPTTFHALARAGLELELGGRFANETAVIGSTPDAGALYPAAGIAQADIGEELPVGDDQRPEPVGTVSEIEASLARLERERGDAE